MKNREQGSPRTNHAERHAKIMIELGQAEKAVAYGHGEKNQQGQQDILDGTEALEILCRVRCVPDPEFTAQAAQPVLKGAKGANKTAPGLVEGDKKEKKSQQPSQHTNAPAAEIALEGGGHLMLQAHEVAGPSPHLIEHTRKGWQLVANIYGQVSTINEECKAEDLHVKPKAADITVIDGGLQFTLQKQSPDKAFCAVHDR